MDEAVKVFFILAAVVGGPMLAVMVIPQLVKRVFGPAPRARPREVDDDTESQLENLSQRLAELEERVDFAERLLARQRDDALPKPRS
jgi:hypothetical protein